MSEKSDQGQSIKIKIKWAIDNYYNQGKSRPEAVKGLTEKYDITYNYARTLIYNHLCYLDWKRAPYPQNRKSRIKKELDKEALKEKFKVVNELNLSSLTSISGDFSNDAEF